MLMMLAAGLSLLTKGHPLMLMMLAGLVPPKMPPADAHDARCWASFLPKGHPLMLMMLAAGPRSSQKATR